HYRPTVVGDVGHTPPFSPYTQSFAQPCTAPYPAKSSALIRCPARIATQPPHNVTTAGSASRTSVPAACGFTIPLTPRTTWNVCTSPVPVIDVTRIRSPPTITSSGNSAGSVVQRGPTFVRTSNAEVVSVTASSGSPGSSVDTSTSEIPPP